MPPKKFELLTMLQHGMLPRIAKWTWTLMFRRRAKLIASLESLDEAMGKFVRRHTEHIPPCIMSNGAIHAATLTDKGEIITPICPCWACQARYQSLPEAEVVELMITAGYIRGLGIENARQQVKERQKKDVAGAARRTIN